MMYYVDKVDGRIKTKRKCFMRDDTIKIEDDFYSDMTIKGEIIE